MNSDPERQKLDDLAARIQQAEAKPAPQASDEATKPVKISSVGFDFLGAVLVCAFVGWLVDRTFGSSPWGLIGMMLMGFAIGIMNVWRALGNQKSE